MGTMYRWQRYREALAIGTVLCVGGAIGISAIASAPAASAASLRKAVHQGGSALLLAPDDPATGDPEPPDQTPVPDGLDEPAPVPDDSVAEFPPPARPGLVLNANTVPIAWIGTPDQRPADPALLTLQTALNTVPIGGTVSVDPNDYAFTGALTVGRSVTIDSASSSTLFSRFTVSGGGLQLAEDVEIGVASTGATVSVTASGAVLTGLTVRNPSAVARPTGIQLAAGLTGVTVSGFTMDGGGEASSYGVNLTTGSATITDPEISGVASGVVVTAAATTSGVVVSGGHITAATSGISLGTANAPQVSTVDVTSAGGAGTGIDLASSSSAIIDQVAVHGFARGIGTGTGNAANGPTITDATIDGVGREGIALGSTTGASVVRADITGTDANQSTGILVFKSTGITIDAPTITGTMYGITTHIDNTGAGPTITAPRITAFGAITLGSTQGASVTDAESELGHRALASLRGETLVQRERPDFEDSAHRVLLEAMIVDDHPRPGKKDALRAREGDILKELREAGFAEIAPNASLFAIVDSGLQTDEDHNYRAYLNHFGNVVRKHASKVTAYRAQHPSFDLGFLIFDESTAYVESLGAFGRHSQGRPHAHFADQAFLDIIRGAGIDYAMWMTPYKLINTDEGTFPLPELTVIDVSLLDDSSHESYEVKRMKSSEK